MTAVSVSKFSEDAGTYVAHAVAHQDIVRVTTDEGNAVLVSEDEFRGMLETLHLMKSSGMAERVEEAKRTPIEESDDFAW